MVRKVRTTCRLLWCGVLCGYVCAGAIGCCCLCALQCVRCVHIPAVCSWLFICAGCVCVLKCDEHVTLAYE